MNYTESLAYLDSRASLVLNQVWSALKVFCASWAILSKKSKPYMLRVRMVCWRFLLSGGEFSCLPPGGLLITVAAFG